MNVRFPILSVLSTLMRLGGFLLFAAGGWLFWIGCKQFQHGPDPAVAYQLLNALGLPMDFAPPGIVVGAKVLLLLLAGGLGLIFGLVLIMAGELVGVLFAIEGNTRKLKKGLEASRELQQTKANAKETTSEEGSWLERIRVHLGWIPKEANFGFFFNISYAETGIYPTLNLTQKLQGHYNTILGSTRLKDRFIEACWMASFGFAPAMVKLGECYLHGLGVQQNAIEAAKWFQAVLKPNCLPSPGMRQFWLVWRVGAAIMASIIILGGCISLLSNNAMGIGGKLLVTLFGVGLIVSMWGSWLSVWKDTSKELYNDAGPRARISLGACYAMGMGVDKNPTEAARLFREVTEDRFIESAKYGLAVLGQSPSAYMEPREIKPDPAPQSNEAAAAKLKIAAENGDSDAMHALGEVCAKSGNTAEAVRWWQKAAEQGNPDALYQLGATWEAATSVPDNHANAIKYWKLAGEKGHVEALNRLTWLYTKTSGNGADDAEVMRWLKLAADKGSRDARKELERRGLA